MTNSKSLPEEVEAAVLARLGFEPHMIKCFNVFGDNWRVNVYTKTFKSANCIVPTLKIVDSFFLHYYANRIVFSNPRLPNKKEAETKVEAIGFYDSEDFGKDIDVSFSLLDNQEVRK